MPIKRSVRAVLLLALAALVALTAACGDDGDDAAADTDGGEASSPVDEGAFPVTIEHAFGAPELTEAPQRVVTWGWGSTDAALAPGVLPVDTPLDDHAPADPGARPRHRQH